MPGILTGQPWTRPGHLSPRDVRGLTDHLAEHDDDGARMAVETRVLVGAA